MGDPLIEFPFPVLYLYLFPIVVHMYENKVEQGAYSKKKMGRKIV